MQEHKYQHHKIILWKKPLSEETQFSEIVQNTVDTLSIFYDLPEQYRPNFYTSNRKSSAKPFVLSCDEIASYLQRNVLKVNYKECPELGVNFALFSSMDDHSAFGYGMRVGVKDAKYNNVNVLIVNIALDYKMYDEESARLIETLFEKSVSVFKPFWGAIVNNCAYNDNEPYMVNGLPTNVHWMNYWSDDIIDRIGFRKIKKAKKKFEQFDFENGIIKLQNLPINANNVHELEYQAEIEKLLLPLE